MNSNYYEVLLAANLSIRDIFYLKRLKIRDSSEEILKNYYEINGKLTAKTALHPLLRQLKQSHLSTLKGHFDKNLHRKSK